MLEILNKTGASDISVASVVSASPLPLLVTGFERVRAAPAILVGVYVVTLAAALPFALLLRSSLQAHLGSSLMAESAADRVNWDWWQEFSGQASGLEATFTPTVIGFAAPLDNLSSFLDQPARPMAIILAAVGYGAAWLFLWGGVIDRYARARPTYPSGFFAACGVFFFRFLRLGLLAVVFYWLLLGPAHDRLFGGLYNRVTRDLTVERVAFLWRAAFYAVFVFALMIVNIIFDYAKIRMVVEDRRSAIGALIAALRFVVRHPRGTSALYLANGVLFLLIMAVYFVAAPGAGGAGFDVWSALIIGQAYIVARLFSRLMFAASQTTLFQQSLAHAVYIGSPLPVWPESPAAEAIVKSH